jgi:hypothetical protein
MTDPAGSDRLQRGVPTGDAAGDGGDLGASTEDVPLTRNEAIERDATQDDEQPARVTSDVGLSERADPDGSA